MRAEAQVADPVRPEGIEILKMELLRLREAIKHFNHCLRTLVLSRGVGRKILPSKWRRAWGSCAYAWLSQYCTCRNRHKSNVILSMDIYWLCKETNFNFSTDNSVPTNRTPALATSPFWCLSSQRNAVRLENRTGSLVIQAYIWAAQVLFWDWYPSATTIAHNWIVVDIFWRLSGELGAREVVLFHSKEWSILIVHAVAWNAFYDEALCLWTISCVSPRFWP